MVEHNDSGRNGHRHGGQPGKGTGRNDLRESEIRQNHRTIPIIAAIQDSL